MWQSGRPAWGHGRSPLSCFCGVFFLKHLLSKPEMPPTYVVEWAHQVPPGAPPRPFLVRFLNIFDWDQRHTNTLRWKSMKTPWSRCSWTSQQEPRKKKHRSFKEVCQSLRQKGPQYCMLYPSRVWDQHQGSGKFFDTLHETNEWLDSLWRCRLPITSFPSCGN